MIVKQTGLIHICTPKLRYWGNGLMKYFRTMQTKLVQEDTISLNIH